MIGAPRVVADGVGGGGGCGRHDEFAGERGRLGPLIDHREPPPPPPRPRGARLRSQALEGNRRERHLDTIAGKDCRVMQLCSADDTGIKFLLPLPPPFPAICG